jgi:hypothetical protein
MQSLIPSENDRQSTSAAGARLRVDPENSIAARPARSGPRGTSSDPLAVQSRYVRLRGKLERAMPKLIISKQLVHEVAPDLLEMEKLLSPCIEHDLDVLRSAGVPTWSSFQQDFSRKVGYTLHELRNLQREQRGLAKISPKAKTMDHRCKEMLIRLLDVLETCGDHVPLIAIDVARSIQAVLNGTLTVGSWRKMQKAFDRVQQRSNVSSEPQVIDAFALRPVSPKPN